MSKDTSGPAFPVSSDDERSIGETGWGALGLSIRQYAAIKAMAGLLSNGNVIGHLTAYAQQQKKPLQEIVASAAVNYADALLAELEK